jgi:C4-dicarboxylate transporter DctM subunit
MIIFPILIALLLAGLPVSFALGLSSMICVKLAGFPLSIVAQRMCDGVNSFALVALPMFMLSGEIMAYGCTPRIVKFVNMIFGRAPGGLGSVTIASCTFFSAISGSGSATVAAIGGVTCQELIRQNYRKGYIASMLASAGGLGILIPPSIPMVVYGISAQQSISRLFAAGVIPGIFIAVCLIVFNTIVSKRNGYGISEKHQYTSGEVMAITLDALLPLGMPAIVLGGVMFGIFTATESSIIATVYSIILAAFVYREFKFKNFVTSCKKAMSSSTIVLFVIACANAFAWYLTIDNVSAALTSAFIAFSSNKIIIMLMITALLLLLGTFMETSCIVLITTPILLPVVVGLGYDPIHYGILLITNCIIGAMTPPLAVTLFLSTQMCGIDMQDAFPDILYFIAIYILLLLVLTFIPGITLWLPSVGM